MNKIHAMLIILCLNNIGLKAQYKERQIDLLHLSLKNTELFEIMDSIILHEKKCDYYSHKTYFSIFIRKTEDKFLLQIEAGNDLNIQLRLNTYGFLYHKEHLFFVGGDNCEDLFSTCGEKRIFKYLEYDSNYQPKDGKKIIYFFNDDSFSQWQYWYINKEFILEGKSTFCE